MTQTHSKPEHNRADSQNAVDAKSESATKSVTLRSKREAKLDKYREQRNELDAELKTLNNRRKKVIAKSRNVSNAIYDLLHESEEVPSVTDHAVVRYLERVKGFDIRGLKAEIANHKQAQRIDNVIVTVNADDALTDLQPSDAPSQDKGDSKAQN